MKAYLVFLRHLLCMAGGRLIPTKKCRARTGIVITAYDLVRLAGSIAQLEYRSNKRQIRKLLKILSYARVVDSKEISPEIVTMNSKVRLKDYVSGEKKTICLVFPPDGDLSQDKLSVFSPLGMRLLGTRNGEAVIKNIRVTEIIYQPETAKDFDL